jgi:hypothetical protein
MTLLFTVFYNEYPCHPDQREGSRCMAVRFMAQRAAVNSHVTLEEAALHGVAHSVRWFTPFTMTLGFTVGM